MHEKDEEIGESFEEKMNLRETFRWTASHQLDQATLFEAMVPLSTNKALFSNKM